MCRRMSKTIGLECTVALLALWLAGCGQLSVESETRDWIDGLLEPVEAAAPPAAEAAGANVSILNDASISPFTPEQALPDEYEPGSATTSFPTFPELPDEPDIPLLPSPQLTWQVVDTGQLGCYDDAGDRTLWFNWPKPGEAFYGQDGQFDGNRFNYAISVDDLTVSDAVTQLTWMRNFAVNPDDEDDFRFTHEEALEYIDWLNAEKFGGFSDWRLPSVKELYSLMNFSGNSNTDTPDADGTPYIDDSVFGFRWGDPDGDGVDDEGGGHDVGTRAIDAQYWSSTKYVGRVYGDDEAAFGVNFGDGRIKAYVIAPGSDKYGGKTVSEHFVRAVRGQRYGFNRFVDNSDGTISDLASGLMWTTKDSGADEPVGLDWRDALAYAEDMTTGGHDDWRVPNIKELQSIVDYARAPDALDADAVGPAIDPVFEMTASEAYFWSSTTHLEAHLPPPNDADGSFAAYVCFGQALGQDPMAPEHWLNVHGAGAQRSDPKSGDPALLRAQFPLGFGPQGDDLRVLNHVRCVRLGATPANGPDRNGDFIR